jgi:acylphosphatase
MIEEMLANVKGRVQGVGFRATAKYLAETLQIHGYARNLSDGSVEIRAQGTKKNLEELLRRLKEEFRDGYIDDIEISFFTSEQKYSGFKVN